MRAKSAEGFKRARRPKRVKQEQGRLFFVIIIVKDTPGDIISLSIDPNSDNRNGFVKS